MGIDLESGGCIFYFSLLAHDRNLLNYYDRGRFIQQSYYGDEKNWGIGVFTPGTKELTCYRFRGKSGPEGSGCIYFAPIRSLAIIPDIELEYDVYITIGNIVAIRDRFYNVHTQIVK